MRERGTKEAMVGIEWKEKEREKEREKGASVGGRELKETEERREVVEKSRAKKWNTKRVETCERETQDLSEKLLFGVDSHLTWRWTSRHVHGQ